METTNRPPSASVIGRGVVSGVAGTAVMTAFQKLIEMPLTQREESFAQPTSPKRSRRSRRRQSKAAGAILAASLVDHIKTPTFAFTPALSPVLLRFWQHQWRENRPFLLPERPAECR
jgi:hypothetical protein